MTDCTLNVVSGFSRTAQYVVSGFSRTSAISAACVVRSERSGSERPDNSDCYGSQDIDDESDERSHVVQFTA
jgi:hypothetical protein